MRGQTFLTTKILENLGKAYCVFALHYPKLISKCAVKLDATSACQVAAHTDNLQLNILQLPPKQFCYPNLQNLCIIFGGSSQACNFPRSHPNYTGTTILLYHLPKLHATLVGAWGNVEDYQPSTLAHNLCILSTTKPDSKSH